MSDWNTRVIEEFRRTGGTVETNGFGRRLVLLHHVGARSGAERVSPVAAIPTGDGSWWVAASKAGAPENPAWFHNLMANPDTTIETPDHGVVPVRARRLEGAEREAAWARFTEMSEGFRRYEERTTRVIPVVELAPRGS